MSTGNSAGYKEQMWNTFKVNVGVFTNMCGITGKAGSGDPESSPS